MMGTRGTTNGDEYEAFTRRARRLFHWRSGKLSALKRRFWKRMRTQVRQRTQAEGKADG